MGSHESSSWETEISNFILFHRKTWSLIVMGLLILLLFYCISEGGDLQKFYKDVNGRQALLVGSSWPMAWSSTGRLRASCISQLYFSIVFLNCISSMYFSTMSFCSPGRFGGDGRATSSPLKLYFSNVFFHRISQPWVSFTWRWWKGNQQPAAAKSSTCSNSWPEPVAIAAIRYLCTSRFFFFFWFLDCISQMYFFNVLLNQQNPPLAATAIAAKQFLDFLIFFWISRFFWKLQQHLALLLLLLQVLKI